MAGFSLGAAVQLAELQGKIAAAATTVAHDRANEQQKVAALRVALADVAAPAGGRSARDFDAMATVAAVAVLMLAGVVESAERGRR